MGNLFAYWDLVFPLLIGAGLIAALFYVQGNARVIIRMALVGIVILSAQTLLQGTWTERWRIRPVSEQEQALAARLKNVPTTIGAWDSVESNIDERGWQARAPWVITAANFTIATIPRRQFVFMFSADIPKT